MLTCYVEASRENGFVLIVYKGKNEPVYGIQVDPDDLDEELENGIRYQFKIDALFHISEIDSGEEHHATVDVEFLDPFEGDNGEDD